MCIFTGGFERHSQVRRGLIPAHARKPVEEVVQEMPRFQVVDERLDGGSRTGEDKLSTHYTRAARDDPSRLHQIFYMGLLPIALL